MLEMGERGVPGVLLCLLGDPTPGSNAGKPSPFPPPPLADGGGHLGAASPRPRTFPGIPLPPGRRLAPVPFPEEEKKKKKDFLQQRLE